VSDPNQQGSLELNCRKVYADIDKFWQSSKGKFPTWELGYAILFSPPRFQPDLVLLGHNPSAYANTPYPQTYNPLWPSANELVTESYPFAKKLQRLFASIGATDALANSVHMNLNFFRSRPASAAEHGFRWKDNPVEIRERIEKRSLASAIELLDLMQPKLVVATGIEVFTRVGGVGIDIVPRRGSFRRCVRGLAGVHQLIGIPHPTGAQVSLEDWSLIMNVIRAAL
jgi:hypothetical protein